MNEQENNIFRQFNNPISFGRKSTLPIQNIENKHNNDNISLQENVKVEKNITVEFNHQRGIFIANYAKYEFMLCQITHGLINAGENIKMTNSTAHRLDELKIFKSKENNINSMLGQLRTFYKKFENFEILRNLIAHGNLIPLKEGKIDIFLLEAFSNNGKSKKIESLRLTIDELILKSQEFEILLNAFETKAKTIINKLGNM